MREASPSAIYLKDYTEPEYLIEDVDLIFELGEEFTSVTSTLSVTRNDRATHQKALTLQGEQLELISIKLDGRVLTSDEYEIDDEELKLKEAPDRFELEISTRIRPQENKSLEGLYKSSGNFCTQCEAEGFRKITYFLDRPDVMSRYKTTIIADRDQYPVLLSNGNEDASGDCADGRHWVRWVDPYAKPCYLFALVAGRLEFIEQMYTTASGRPVRCRIYVQAHNIDQCDHAMRSLIKAMRWDEVTFGREYDLDVYNIVAVDDFNMGAMENKGLNIFNSKYVLAKQDTATDADFINIESVIAHEYFHNWTGNRITCRDWFQLTLKEGLTVFRDQQFTADMNAAAPKRIDDVNVLRTSQFAEDAGPMAHPIQPDSYVEINNFYTVTVYNKGAEVIRMIHTLLGAEGFRKGMDLYFERHDGQAVTTEEFVKAMEDANDADLTQFRRWYHQAGTPIIKVAESYDDVEKRYHLTLTQSTPATPGQEEKLAFDIPVSIALMDDDGEDMTFDHLGKSVDSLILRLDEEEQTFTFGDVAEKPHLSILRNYSAPVKCVFDQSDEELAFCMSHDSDEFNRWEAGQQLSTHLIFDSIEKLKAGDSIDVPDYFIEATQHIISDETIDKSLIARALSLPSHSYIAGLMEMIDVDGIHQSITSIERTVATRLKNEWMKLYEDNQSADFTLDPASMGQRSLKNQALYFMVLTGDDDCLDIAEEQFFSANNMTDQQAAFRVLVHNDSGRSDKVIEAFYDRWREEQLVMDKWFMMQASAPKEGTLARVKALLEHPDFDIKNPNRLRSLLGVFCAANPICFHNLSGDGYRLLSSYISRVNDFNPQMAARLTIPLTRYKKYDDIRQQLMKAELENILTHQGISRDVYELVTKSLS